MSAFGHTEINPRHSHRAKLGIATGVAAIALPLIGATSAHAAENDHAPNPRPGTG